MEIYELTNQIQHYAWGSPRWIPELLGEPNPEGSPWAELWMGVHPGGPSLAALPGGEALPLAEVIQRDKARYLGEAETLPFLFKALAAAKPLSIQAHPNREQAREGFDRENQAGVPLDAPERNYKDPFPKPEILCPLIPFQALCGFRERDEIMRLLALFLDGAPRQLKDDFDPVFLGLTEGEPPLEAFFTALFAFTPETLLELGRWARREGRLLKELPGEGTLIASLAEAYPTDPGVIAPLYLNFLELKAGEAIFLPAGVLHAYVRGFAMELMAASDNVLRGGLTPKHVDTEELRRVLRFQAFKPKVMTAPPHGAAWNHGSPSGHGASGPSPNGFFTYPTEADEFSLSVMTGAGSAVSVPWPLDNLPSIVFVTGGQAAFTPSQGQRVVLRRGKSAFIPPVPQGESLAVTGAFTLYAGSPRILPRTPPAGARPAGPRLLYPVSHAHPR